MNPKLRTLLGTVPGTIRNTDVENREPNGNRFLDDHHPELGPSVYQFRHSIDSDPDEAPHIATEVPEEMPYCSSGTSFGKQRKARSTTQPQFRSENTPARNEADQILLAHQQLTSNTNNSINRVSKLPKSFTTTMPTFDVKSENFELFEGLFQTNLEIHICPTDEDKINYFHHLIRCDALQRFKKIAI